MTKETIKKIAIGAVTTAVVALPVIAFAEGPDLGLNYATAIGLGTQDVRTTISGVIKAFMGLLGIVAVVIILLGGVGIRNRNIRRQRRRQRHIRYIKSHKLKSFASIFSIGE